MAVYNGTSGDDNITGTNNDDMFFASPGMDVFDAGAGSDTLDLSSLSEPARLIFNFGTTNFEVEHGASREHNIMATNFEIFIGTSGRDEFFASSTSYNQDMTIFGEGGNDFIQAGLGNDIIDGGIGDDFMLGNDGVDTFIGGAGIRDWVGFEVVHQNTEGVRVDLRSQTILNDGFGNVETMSDVEGIWSGTAYRDIIDGDVNANYLQSTGFNDIIRAREGDDFVEVDGAGTFNGGTGSDRFSLTSSVTWEPDGDNNGLWDLVRADQMVEYDMVSGDIINDGYGNSGTAREFENIKIYTNIGAILIGDDNSNGFTILGDGGSLVHAGAGNDSLWGWDGIDVFYGENGDDRLYGRDGNDVLHGGDNNDSLYGDEGNDELFGGDGTDFLDGGTGNDLLYGQAGSDNLNGDANADILYGGAGADVLNGNSGHDILYGGLDADKLFGNGGDDELRGGSGNDTLSGNLGADSLYGGGGRDILLIDTDDTIIDGGSGYDRAIVTVAASSLNLDLGTTNIEQVWGNDTAENFDGSSAASFVKIFGGGEDDTIIGSNFGDRLYGEAGDDTMTGGTGNDRFFFENSWGNDTITDFTLGGGSTGYARGRCQFIYTANG